MAKYQADKEVILFGTDEIHVPEIRVRYNRGKNHTKIKDSKSTYEFLLKVYGRDISIQEQMIALFLDNSLNILGYYKHTIGTPTASLMDVPMILGIALKSMARNIILSHNHPSENVNPSDSDRKITNQMSEGAKSVKLILLDHLIVTKNNGFYSFADNHNLLSGIGNKDNSLEQQLRQEILAQLSRVTNSNAPKVFELIQSESGYRNAEQRIINLVIRERITPSASIPQIENEL